MGAANSSNILPSTSASTVPTSRNQESLNEIDFEVEESLRYVDGVNEDAMRSDVRSSTYNITGEPRPQMTYAARTTNWRGLGEASGSTFRLKHRENLELSQIILQLAKANQQLTGAHSAVLAQLEGLYLELKRERSSQKFNPNGEGNNSTNATSRKRLTTTCQDTRNEQGEENDTRRNLERRLDRLESVLACRLEEQSSFLNERVPVRVEVDKPGHDQQFSRISRHNSSRERSINGNFQDVPLDSERIERSCENSGVMDTRLSSCNVHSRLDKTLDRRVRSNDEEEHVERLTNDEIIKFLEEIRALKADKVEYLSTNERLNKNLKEQKIYTEKLCKDYEILREQCEKLKSSLDERRQQHEKLLKDFDLTKSETREMLKKITSFQLEKDTAEARISSLERDLKRALLEKEQFKDTKNEEISKLKVQLAEEIDDKKKHMKALEDALNEIQRLKDAAKTESNNIEETATEDDIDCTQSTNEISETSANDRVTNLDLLKKELTLKREARQRAIAAVSSEMERLRQELETEKEAHSETSRVLDRLRSTQNNLQINTLGNSSVCDKSNKMSKSVEEDCDKNEILSRRIEVQRLSSILKVSDELRNNIRFQIEKIDDLRYQLESEPDQHRYQIRCLTDVSNKTRDTLKTRERRANELKDYLARNLARLNDRSFLDFKDDVSAECERQLESINSLRSLYNERLRVLSELKDAAVKELIDVKENLKHSSKECEGLEEDLRKAEEKIDTQDTEISNLESQLGLTKADCRDLQNQMSLINSLFTQMLLGASSADMDLDRLSQLLQENRDLITDIARDNGTEAAALPKLLLDLVEQVDGNKGSQKRNEDDQQHEEIAHNLPKVWRVLLELLSCHAAASHHQNASEASSSDSNSCYKSVDTPSGPKLVISVSKTYIHLKELILEKKHLEKEMNRMKQLNTHLESKLGEQEKRLSAVTAELSKTWNVVGRMQAQHQQLHTHEKILRYELQQKRKMLQELKLELEYCREKWESARQKNTNTELEWRSLRREFAARKMLSVHDSVNNSAESGFSDERGDDSDDDDDAVDDRVRMGLTRRTRKESPKTSPVEIGLEQQTKTELPDSEASSSSALTNQVPPSAQETELNKAEVVDTTLPTESTSTQESDLVSEVLQQTLDPLDQALTTVIRNLIRIEDDTESSSDEFASRENITLPFMRLVDSVRSENNLEGSNNDLADQKECSSDNDDNEGKENTDIESCCPESNTSETCSNVETDNIMTLSSNSKLDPEEIQDTEKILKSIDEPVLIENISDEMTENAVNSISVFSIGPFPVNRNMHSPNHIFTPFFNDSSETNSITDDVSASNQSETESSVLQNDAKEIDNSIISLNTKESAESSNEVSENMEKEPKPKSETSNTNPEQVLTAREDRLKRLEEQAQWLMKKMNATSRRGSALSTRLEALHETYGEPSAPVPDVLQNRTTQSTPSSSISQATKSSNDDDTKNVQAPTEDKETDEPSSDNKT